MHIWCSGVYLWQDDNFKRTMFCRLLQDKGSSNRVSIPIARHTRAANVTKENTLLPILNINAKTNFTAHPRNSQEPFYWKHHVAIFFPSMPENLSAVIRSLTALECLFILDLYIKETDFLHGQSWLFQCSLPSTIPPCIQKNTRKTEVQNGS